MAARTRRNSALRGALDMQLIHHLLGSRDLAARVHVVARVAVKLRQVEPQLNRVELPFRGNARGQVCNRRVVLADGFRLRSSALASCARKACNR